jgi:hypothetical protein
VYLNNVIVENWSEWIVNWVKMLWWLSLYHTNVTIENIIIRNNKADDWLNIKNARVSINNSSFINNAADQFDCDYCIGSIKNSEFYVNMKNPDGDGLDVSWSDLTIQGNNFTGFWDKGISIGEKTYVFIEENTFIDNNLWMAIKDASQAYVWENIFNDNKLDIVLYQKKEIFWWAWMHSTQQILNNLEIELDKRSSKIYYDTRESLSLAYKSHGTGE